MGSLVKGKKIFNSKGEKGDTGTGLIDSVTGNAVDNTDPANPIITAPINTAPANYVTKSDGTNVVQSQIFDDGSFVGIGATSALGFEVFRLDNNGVGFAHTGHTSAYVSTFLNSAASGGIAANTTDFLLTNDSGVTLTLSTSNITSNGNIIPTVTNSKSLGSDTYAWQNLYLTSAVIFEGSTADGYETTLTVADPTADRTITLPNASGTVSLQTGQTYTPSNVTTSRTFDADTVTLAELADIVGTLLTDLSGKVNN